MELIIKKQVEEIIKIETPRFFKSKYTSRIVKLTETGLTRVADDLIIYSAYDSKCEYFKKDVMELLNDFTEVSKLEFEEKFSSTLLKMQVVAYE